jgi:hypothetical protein
VTGHTRSRNEALDTNKSLFDTGTGTGASPQHTVLYGIQSDQDMQSAKTECIPIPSDPWCDVTPITHRRGMGLHITLRSIGIFRDPVSRTRAHPLSLHTFMVVTSTKYEKATSSRLQYRRDHHNCMVCDRLNQSACRSSHHAPQRQSMSEGPCRSTAVVARIVRRNLMGHDRKGADKGSTSQCRCRSVQGARISGVLFVCVGLG